MPVARGIGGTILAVIPFFFMAVVRPRAAHLSSGVAQQDGRGANALASAWPRLVATGQAEARRCGVRAAVLRARRGHRLDLAVVSISSSDRSRRRSNGRC